MRFPLLVSLFAALPALAAGPGTAAGTLTVNGKAAKLTHAYAARRADPFDKSKQATYIVLADQEVPPAAVFDMAEMMKNPLVKEMLKSMLATKAPEGNVSKDGRSYSNDAVGLAITMPESAKNWKLDGSPKMPMTLALVESPDHVANVQIASQTMPMAMPIETIGPMLEMGFKMAFKQYTKYSDGLIGEGPSKGYEFHYSGEQAGVHVHMLTRFYMRDGKMLVINASTEEGNWKANEKTLKDVLNAIKLTEPKVSPVKEGIKE